jgi:hypothetical protein
MFFEHSGRKDRENERHVPLSSLPDLIRQSIPSRWRAHDRSGMDARVKPGHDDDGRVVGLRLPKRPPMSICLGILARM